MILEENDTVFLGRAQRGEIHEPVKAEGKGPPWMYTLENYKIPKGLIAMLFSTVTVVRNPFPSVQVCV